MNKTIVLSVPTTALLPGDEWGYQEAWGTIFDRVESVVLPEPPAVAARVNLIRTRTEGGNVTSAREFTYCGVNAVHQVTRGLSTCPHGRRRRP